MKELLKFKIAFAIVGVLTIALIVGVVLQAGSAKQDKQTTQAATDIAVKLNDYTSQHQVIPSSLKSIGVKDSPSTITYHKLSSTRYKFCASYRSDSTNVHVPQIAPRYGYVDDIGGLENATSSSWLIIPTDHKSGESCQTIKPLAEPPTSATANPNVDNYVAAKCGRTYGNAWSALKVTAIQQARTDASAKITVLTYPTDTTYEVDSQAKIFDVNCNEQKLSDLLNGQYVTLYFGNDGTNIVMITKDS